MPSWRKLPQYIPRRQEQRQVDKLLLIQCGPVLV
jgi:hypothetical protein